MILLSSYQYIRQIFKTSEIVSITAKQYILKSTKITRKWSIIDGLKKWQIV